MNHAKKDYFSVKDETMVWKDGRDESDEWLMKDMEKRSSREL